MMPITHSSLAGGGWWFKFLKIASSPWPKADDPGLSSEHQFSQLTCTVNICEHSLSYFSTFRNSPPSSAKQFRKKSKPAACSLPCRLSGYNLTLGLGAWHFHAQQGLLWGLFFWGWDGAFKAGTLIGNWFEDGQRRGLDPIWQYKNQQSLWIPYRRCGFSRVRLDCRQDNAANPLQERALRDSSGEGRTVPQRWRLSWRWLMLGRWEEHAWLIVSMPVTKVAEPCLRYPSMPASHEGSPQCCVRVNMSQQSLGSEWQDGTKKATIVFFLTSFLNISRISPSFVFTWMFTLLLITYL